MSASELLLYTAGKDSIYFSSVMFSNFMCRIYNFKVISFCSQERSSGYILMHELVQSNEHDILKNEIIPVLHVNTISYRYDI